MRSRHGVRLVLRWKICYPGDIYRTSNIRLRRDTIIRHGSRLKCSWRYGKCPPHKLKSIVCVAPSIATLALSKLESQQAGKPTLVTFDIEEEGFRRIQDSIKPLLPVFGKVVSLPTSQHHRNRIFTLGGQRPATRPWNRNVECDQLTQMPDSSVMGRRGWISASPQK